MIGCSAAHTYTVCCDIGDCFYGVDRLCWPLKVRIYKVIGFIIDKSGAWYVCHDKEIGGKYDPRERKFPASVFENCMCREFDDAESLLKAIIDDLPKDRRGYYKITESI